MLEGIYQLIAKRPYTEVLVDVLDLFLVSYIIYRVLLVMRGTRAMQIGLGLGVMLLVYFVSKWAGLVTLFNLLSYLLSSLILVIVVVFQNDIRRGLMRVGSRAVFTTGHGQQAARLVEEVSFAATELARHRMGALICFEQEAHLDEFVASGGTTIDAEVQRDLLVSLFVPEGVNKLHDGAVIIRNMRIARAGVFFPMPDLKAEGSGFVDKSLGTRHRAAIGLSDETDAVVVVVSEERGTISICFNGNIIPNLDGMTLRQALLGLLGESKKEKKAKQAKEPTESKRQKLKRLVTPASVSSPLTKRAPASTGERPPLSVTVTLAEREDKPVKPVVRDEPETKPMKESESTTSLPVTEPVTVPMQASESATPPPVQENQEPSSERR